MDISAIASALSSVKTASEIAQLLKQSSSSFEQAEAKLRLADLISALADARMQIAEVKEALIEKDSEIRALTDAALRKNQLEWEKPYYWLKLGADRDGPYCQKCYDSESKLIRLQGGQNGTWSCFSCKCTVVDKDYQRPKPRQPRRVARPLEW